MATISPMKVSGSTSLIRKKSHRAFSNDDEEEDSNTDDDNVEGRTLPTTEVLVMVTDSNGEPQQFLALLDSGTSRSLVQETMVHKLHLHVTQNKKVHRYTMAVGTFETKDKCRLRHHTLPEFTTHRKIPNTILQVTSRSLGSYDLILGRDYMIKFGIDMKFSTRTIVWDEMTIEMHEQGYFKEGDRTAAQEYYMEPQVIQDLTEECHAQQILDSKYEKQDLQEVVKTATHLSLDQQDKLLELLMEYEDRFTGKLGEWPDFTVDIDMKPDAKPYHIKTPYRIPQIYWDTLKKEVERLV
jgi:hypothetical protein